MQEGESGVIYDGKTLLDQNKVTRFGGQYSTEVIVDKKFYLLNEIEITQEQAVGIATVLGLTGPGRQVVMLNNGKFYLLSDEASEAAKARIDKEMVALDNEPLFESDSNDSGNDDSGDDDGGETPVEG